MGKAIPTQHPAVVLRSQYKQLRTMLAIAMIPIAGLSAAVVILATDDDRDASPTSASVAQPVQPINYGNFNPLTGRPYTAPFPQRAEVPNSNARFDGGPEEGTRGVVAQSVAPTTRSDGGPEEGTRGIVAEPVAPTTRSDGGPEEGTRGPAPQGGARP